MQQGFQAKATGRTSDIQDLNNITSICYEDLADPAGDLERELEEELTLRLWA